MLIEGRGYRGNNWRNTTEKYSGEDEGITQWGGGTMKSYTKENEGKHSTVKWHNEEI